MGKTSKKLNIVAIGPVSEWEELDKLEKQGHLVVRLTRIENGFRTNIESHTDLLSLILEADVVLGPKCWRMDGNHKQYLSLALKEARMLRYDNHAERANSKIRSEFDYSSDLDAKSSNGNAPGSDD